MTHLLRTAPYGVACYMVATTLIFSAATHADLVVHFDPNDLSTMFTDPGSGGGTVPLTELGQNAAFVSDVRAPSPGAPLDGFVDAENTATGSPTAAFHPTLGSIFNFNGGQRLLTTTNDRANQDGFGVDVNTNTLTLLVAGRLDAGGAGTDYLFDIRDDEGALNNANDGFGLRYDHTTGLLEGIAKQSVNASTPLATGDWFVALYAWDGANATATLSVETLAGGVTTDTQTAASGVLEADRWRVGAQADNSNLYFGDMGDFLLFNDVLDHSADAAQLAADYLIPLPSLTINRDSGNISIEVPAGAPPLTNIIGYTMTSDAAALNPNAWNSIADNYDADNPGPNQVDPDNNWTELSNANLRSDLSELEFENNGGASNGADFLPATTTDLGNAWIPYFVEDVEITLIGNDNSTIPLEVRYVGNGGESFAFGDLDFDGDIDEDDFRNELLPNYGADLSTTPSAAERYAAGDLDNSGSVRLEDFLLLNEAFLEANPGAASLSLTVPEPASIALLFTMALVGGMRRSAGRCTRRISNTHATNPVAEVARLWRSREKRDDGWQFPGSATSVACGCVQSNVPKSGDFGAKSFVGGLGVLFFAMVVIRGSAVRADILAHWHFDETAGATTLIDSVSGLNGTASNGATGGAVGQIGGAWSFDQPSEQYVDLTHVGSFGGLTQGTISTWFKRPPAGGAAVLISAYDSTVGSTEGRFFFENSDLRWDVRDAGGAIPAEGGNVNAGDQSDDAWHHGVITVDASQNATLYVDGVVAATAAEPFWGQIGTLDGMAIGRNVDSGGGQWYFNGLIDDMQIYDEPLPAPAIQAIYEAGLNGVSLEITDTELKIEVNTITGEITLRNATVLDFDIDAYRITSVGSSLDGAGWSSLEDKDYEGQGPTSGWTELGTGPDELSEGFFGGSTVIASGESVSLGNAYRTSVDAQDLVAQFHLAGADATNFVDAVVQYVAGLSADFDNNNTVDAADLGQWEGDFGLNADSDADSDGRTGGSDFLAWQRQLGTSVAAPAAESVPEPAAGVLLLTAACWLGRRRRLNVIAASVAVAVSLLGSNATPCQADAFVDRDYRLGDDAVEGATLGSVGASTFDSVGVTAAAFPGATNTGAFQDLAATGSPQYVNVGSSGQQRPGLGAAGTGSNPPLGIAFDGVDDRLATDISLNSPNQTWNSDLFPTGIDGLYDPPSAIGADGTGDGQYRPAFPHDYAGIFGRAIQAWVRPTVTGARQDIVIDTAEHGVYITENDTWGLQFDNGETDTGLPVASTLDSNGWAHVMVVSGYPDPVGGGTAFGGALLVNGVAVAADAAFYDNATTGLSIGSNLAGDGNYFQGTLDDVQLLLWGDNSNRDPKATNQEPGYLGGADWGSLTAADNQFIALELAAAAQAAGVGAIPAADVNLDGFVAGDGTGAAASDDVSALVANWQSQNLVDGQPVGDWTSRQQGDLNNDGVTDIFDAIQLRDALVASGSGAFDFSLLAGAPVPEPAAATLLAAGVIALFGSARRPTTRRQ